MGGVGGFVLAGEYAGYLYCETAKGLVFSIDDVPFALYFSPLAMKERVPIHGSSSLRKRVNSLFYFSFYVSKRFLPTPFCRGIRLAT